MSDCFVGVKKHYMSTSPFIVSNKTVLPHEQVSIQARSSSEVLVQILCYLQMDDILHLQII